MADPAGMSEESGVQALNTIIQLHFEKTLEKKRAIDLQKKHLHHLSLLFFIFLALLFLPLSLSPRLRCRHCWIPIALLSFAHLTLYAALAQTLRCINAFKYQRRCHKLTLGLATQKLRDFRVCGDAFQGDLQVSYQEPPESYLGKFKRNWAFCFAFLLLLYAFMLSSSVVLLCS